MTTQEVICNYCADTFLINLDLPKNNYTTTKGGEEVWTCARCKERLMGVV